MHQGDCGRAHPGVRDKLKIACLAVLYGMGAALLAMRIDKPTAVAAAWIPKPSQSLQDVLGISRSALSTT